MRKFAAAAFLFLLPACIAQVVPTYSSQRVDALVKAVGRAEGFGVPGAKPTRFRNPGDLKQDGHYRHFPTAQAGFTALTGQIVRIIEGRSKAYTLRTTIKQMGDRYAGSPRWAANVSKMLNVPASTTLGQFLCGGDLDVPPVVQFN